MLDNWSKDLIELGFAHLVDGEVIIPQDQLCKIVNIYETCLIFDGDKGGDGGRPAVTFYDHKFPEVGKAPAKSSILTTMIGGSNAAGEAVPPHS